MKAVIMAGGKGTRLRPLTSKQPKPMVPIVNTPCMEHIVNLLKDHGFENILATLEFMPEVIQEYFGDGSGWGVRMEYSVEEEPLGTAGSVKFAEDWLTERFVVVSGDALTDVDIGELVAFHREKGALATIALRRVYDTSEFGVVEVDGEGNILGFQEKPDPEDAISTLANTGIYVLEPRALDYIPDGTFYDFARDVFPKFLQGGERFVGYQGDFYWSDIGTLEAYRQAQYDVLSGKVRVRIPGERRGESLWVGEDAQIHPSATIEGHVLVGRDAVVGRGVTLSGDVTVGSDCWIRPGATIKRSILLPGASIGDGAYLEDCIVGHGYDVRPGETIRGGALIRRS